MTTTIETGAQGGAHPTHDRERNATISIAFFLIAVVIATAIATLAFGLAGLTISAVIGAWAILGFLVVMTAGS
ncbi:hypothetical protein [Pontitalea aquivivens]|uniref:hypothetical protein n=1 Tax=Pontitalea aquivivens TaxID=3388663 RepID=UPI003970AF32